MIEVDGFRLSGGGCDFNNTTKRDTPFPNSSSTPLVTINEICDDPSDPDYWKKNITTQEDRSIKVPISQPGMPLTEFAERLIALEQENVVLREELEQLKEVVSLILSLTNQSLPVLSQYHGGGMVPSDKVLKNWYQSIWEWAHNHGVDDFPFKLTPEGLDILPKEERSNDTDGTD